MITGCCSCMFGAAGLLTVWLDLLAPDATSPNFVCLQVPPDMEQLTYKDVRRWTQANCQLQRAHGLSCSLHTSCHHEWRHRLSAKAWTCAQLAARSDQNPLPLAFCGMLRMQVILR